MKNKHATLAYSRADNNLCIILRTAVYLIRIALSFISIKSYYYQDNINACQQTRATIEIVIHVFSIRRTSAGYPATQI